jgi:hypothetical protein
LHLVGAVGVDDRDLGVHQVLIGGEDDVAAIGRPPWVELLGAVGREPGGSGAVGVHGVELGAAIPFGEEHDPAVVARKRLGSPGGACGDAGRRGQRGHHRDGGDQDKSS